VDIKDLATSFAGSKKAMVGFASAMSFVGGAALGAAIAMRKLRASYDESIHYEIAQAKEYYQRLYKADEFATPEKAVASLIPNATVTTKSVLTVTENVELEEAVTALRAYSGHGLPMIDRKPELVEVVKNVFTDAPPAEFDYEAELKTRDPDKPYIISYDEFMEAGPNFTQVQYTYYGGDDVLTDDADDPVSIDDLVGRETLGRFGYGSGDSNTVFVRNNSLQLDIEIAYSSGQYAKDVLGLGEELEEEEVETELRHAHSRPRKFRPGDD
jgi:CBS domain-containing protein